MPLGSSSAAPVIRPGPRRLTKFLSCSSAARTAVGSPHSLVLSFIYCVQRIVSIITLLAAKRQRRHLHDATPCSISDRWNDRLLVRSPGRPIEAKELCRFVRSSSLGGTRFVRTGRRDKWRGVRRPGGPIDDRRRRGFFLLRSPV